MSNTFYSNKHTLYEKYYSIFEKKDEQRSVCYRSKYVRLPRRDEVINVENY